LKIERDMKKIELHHLFIFLKKYFFSLGYYEKLSKITMDGHFPPP
jgi:hypothetical protein